MREINTTCQELGIFKIFSLSFLQSQNRLRTQARFWTLSLPVKCFLKTVLMYFFFLSLSLSCLKRKLCLLPELGSYSTFFPKAAAYKQYWKIYFKVYFWEFDHSTLIKSKEICLFLRIKSSEYLWTYILEIVIWKWRTLRHCWL